LTLDLSVCTLLGEPIQHTFMLAWSSKLATFGTTIIMMIVSEDSALECEETPYDYDKEESFLK